MEHSVTLVEFDESEENNLKVCEDALRRIENLPPTYGIKATAIVGPGRIGKSSLLNWLVGKNVFKTGRGTSRTTRGIWMYIEEDQIRKLANIYIDVEGFGYPLKSNVDENDNRLLNIVIQICDVVLYNIRGVYDSDMRDKIKFVCSLFHKYRKGHAVLEKPILVSVLRDFEFDKPECPDTEFQHMFRQNFELLDTFRQTKVFILVRPKEGGVIDLANTPDSDLCKEFLQGMNEIKEYLTNNTKPLRAASNKTINGIVLAENIRRTVKHVNNDDLRMLSKSLPEILKEKNDVIHKSILDTYKTEMRKKWPLPTQPETLMGLHEMEKNAAVEHIDENCFIISGSIEVDVKAFKVKIENMFKEMQREKCKEALESAVSEIGQKLQKAEYFDYGGEKCFLYDYDKAEKAYREYKNLGPEKLDIWQKYNAEMKTTKELIKQIAKVRDIEKKAAASEKEFNEKNERLEEEKEELEVMRKEFTKSQQNNQILQGILGLGRLLVDFGRGATEMYRKITITNVEKKLLENILPNNDEIQSINRNYGRKSKEMKTLCGNICEVIKRKVYKDAATDIWPAWDSKSETLVFVVETAKITGIKSNSVHTDLKLMEYNKNCSTFEKESHMVMAKEKELLTNQTYDIGRLQSLQKTISTYTKQLMEKHKNITAIFPCIVKSVGYLESGKHRFIEKLCISIRVEKKVSGLIPLEEEPIATNLGTFPTDVIAGDFCFLADGPNDFHENVKIGSAIHAGLVTDNGELLGGTMGCFVKHKIFGLCCLTSAHIILSQSEIQEVLKDGYREYDENNLKPVYQPISERSSQFGKVVSAACIEGHTDMPGVEVALIKIVCRKPISGSFPLIDSNTTHTFMFNSGNVADAKLLRPLTEVFKFGIQTGPTFGLLGIPGASVRYRGGLRLENQLVIMPKKGATFAQNGDSGSTAFIGLSCPGTEAAIGLVTGGFDSGQILVTPIHAALKAVQCPPYLYRFEDVGGDSGFDNDITEGRENMDCN